MVLPNQLYLIVKLYNNRPELLPDSNQNILKMRITKEQIPDYGIIYEELLGRPCCRVYIDKVLMLLNKVERDKIRIL